MATPYKIKIQDIEPLREQLDELYAIANTEQLCDFALQLAEHTLDMLNFPKPYPETISEAFRTHLALRQKEAKVFDLRQVLFALHTQAKSEQEPEKQAALRAVGQALASAHMQEHIMHACDYALRCVGLLYPGDSSALEKERLWQIETLKKLIEY